MYLPALFREDDPALIAALVREYPLATLITTRGGAPEANQLPLLFDPSRGPHGVLRGHMARANPQWRDFEDGAAPVLAVFRGPDAYVSPAWYRPALHVPTWNYAAVSMRGTARLVTDAARFEALLDDLVAANESRRESPWRIDWAQEGMRELMGAIVGFEIELTRVEAKLKLSQNREPEDRERVVARLGESADPRDQAVARLMVASHRPRP